MLQIVPSSEKLKQKAVKPRKHDYPWEMLECGQSFAISKLNITFATLRPMCSKMGTKLNRKFKAVEHEEVYEVGRVE